jgi:hypothetical protein
MPAGIRVWNANGTLQFDTTNRLFRMLTVQLVGSANGSVSVSTIAGGTVVAEMQATGESGKVPPTVTVSGKTVSWDYGSTAAASRDTNARIAIMDY